jgi:hypothetical protein
MLKKNPLRAGFFSPQNNRACSDIRTFSSFSRRFLMLLNPHFNAYACHAQSVNQG